MDSKADALKKLDEFGQKIAELRTRIPADDPLAGPAFRLHALVGKVQAEIAATPKKEGE